MADELLQLYQDVVLEHNRRPRNFVAVVPATHYGRGYNPLCGDSIELTLDVREGVIAAIGFQGESCAIATASASLLTAALEGTSVGEAARLMGAFRDALAGRPSPVPAELEPLLAVRRFPSRIKCASLPWASLEAALAGESRGEGAAATTEGTRQGL